MKGSITASCGCVIENQDDLVSVQWSGEECTSDGFVPAIYHAEFCPFCAAKARFWPEFIAN